MSEFIISNEPILLPVTRDFSTSRNPRVNLQQVESND